MKIEIRKSFKATNTCRILKSTFLDCIKFGQKKWDTNNEGAMFGENSTKNSIDECQIDCRKKQFQFMCFNFTSTI